MIKYSKNIYPQKVLLNAINSYNELCKVNVTENNKYWIIEYEDCIVDEELLNKEFGNYLIDAINEVGVAIYDLV